MGARERSIWSLLLFSGYLKAVSQYRRGDRTFCELQLPNREIRGFFLGAVNSILEEHLDSSTLRALFRALAAGEVPAIEKHLQTLVENMLSFHDVAGGGGASDKGKAPEVVVQSFVLGLLANLGDAYRIRSNIESCFGESGLGRADILMAPQSNGRHSGRPGIVMEFKRLEEGQSMERRLEAALQQIEDKHYGADISFEGVGEILKLAIVVDGKQLRVRRP
uniref:PD-(D/E)XK nuclease superfamily protein n=1 Tax=Candidatus Kentrum sp. FM TaxID=2126340 RepID=A0A450SLW3_9GAMM|nr:MAG: PD-(D/E)XK nuclease superfamily protein [Candidatus Kentron sp. FM]VFJ54729.1 MAG: PD-(D/E)XK nuclease superfamily protein [Candidatus Kentron sp. FM]VFK08030.1 MAG: PD-(D/E)XK nuclease superfamily protein [Candidatus Kentron sp. FM]